jgi:hypothetical protein
MKRSLQLIGSIVAFAAWFSPHELCADPPDIIAAYRFAPRVSTIVPIANPDHELNVYGTFDFIRGWDYRDDPPSIVRYADFENVRAWAQNPLSLAPSLDVDGIFNLSGLQGVELPTASIFEVSKFDGKNLAGDQVELFVSVLGRWLYLRGDARFADQPERGWRVNALARQRPFADFDEDGDVDADDLTAWKDRAGLWTGLNDADGDDFQTGADFLYWQQQLGETPPSPAAFEAAINAALAASAAAVPEPAALTIVAALALLASASRFRRPRRDCLRLDPSRGR